MLGGKDNFAADRELAERMCTIDPGLPGLARANRDFLTAAVRRAAEAGIGQFLDLGAGLPTRPAVHHTAREVNEAARVAYIDNDPVVVNHASALLKRWISQVGGLPRANEGSWYILCAAAVKPG